MKTFEIKTGKYQFIHTGCDYCGENKQVNGYKQPKMPWVKIYLCRECWDIYKNEQAEMRK